MSTASNIGSNGAQTDSSQQERVTGSMIEQSWYAIFTVPKHEKSVLRHLHARGIGGFLPTYGVTRLWRNRQRVKLAVPLFPCYLFAQTSSQGFGEVLKSPGVIRLIGNHCGPLPIPDSAIELLRVSVVENKIQPYRELVVGKRVRVRSGPMQGVEGVLVRQNNSLRFVLSIELINQHAAIEMEAENLEPVSGGQTLNLPRHRDGSCNGSAKPLVLAKA